MKRLIFLILLFSSCTKQHSSGDQLTEVSIDNYSQLGESAIADALQLKFSSMVRSIFEDSKGNLWLGTVDNGLIRFTPKEF